MKIDRNYLFVGTHADFPIHMDGCRNDPVVLETFPTSPLVDLYVGTQADAPIHMDGGRNDPVVFETFPTSPLVDLYAGTQADVPIHMDGCWNDPVVLETFPTSPLVDLYVGTQADIPIHTDGCQNDPVVVPDEVSDRTIVTTEDKERKDDDKTYVPKTRKRLGKPDPTFAIRNNKKHKTNTRTNKSRRT
jgi:hypothetical protein